MPQPNPNELEKLHSELARLSAEVERSSIETKFKLVQQDELHRQEIERIKAGQQVNRREIRANSMGSLVFVGTLCLLLAVVTISIKRDKNEWSYDSAATLAVLADAGTLTAAAGLITAVGALLVKK